RKYRPLQQAVVGLQYRFCRTQYRRVFAICHHRPEQTFCMVHTTRPTSRSAQCHCFRWFLGLSLGSDLLSPSAQHTRGGIPYNRVRRQITLSWLRTPVRWSLELIAPLVPLDVFKLVLAVSECPLPPKCVAYMTLL